MVPRHHPPTAQQLRPSCTKAMSRFPSALSLAMPPLATTFRHPPLPSVITPQRPPTVASSGSAHHAEMDRRGTGNLFAFCAITRDVSIAGFRRLNKRLCIPGFPRTSSRFLVKSYGNLVTKTHDSALCLVQTFSFVIRFLDWCFILFGLFRSLSHKCVPTLVLSGGFL